jgi:hypothetical protein
VGLRRDDEVLSPVRGETFDEALRPSGDLASFFITSPSHHFIAAEARAHPSRARYHPFAADLDVRRAAKLAYAVMFTEEVF